MTLIPASLRIETGFPARSRVGRGLSEWCRPYLDLATGGVRADQGFESYLRSEGRVWVIGDGQWEAGVDEEEGSLSALLVASLEFLLPGHPRSNRYSLL